MKVSCARSSASAWFPAVSATQGCAHRRLVPADEFGEGMPVILNDDAGDELLHR